MRTKYHWNFQYNFHIKIIDFSTGNIQQCILAIISFAKTVYKRPFAFGQNKCLAISKIRDKIWNVGKKKLKIHVTVTPSRLKCWDGQNFSPLHGRQREEENKRQRTWTLEDIAPALASLKSSKAVKMRNEVERTSEVGKCSSHENKRSK